ncbi:MAG TPA: DUF2147 domain-containing protein [Candidatus Binataceae bacterium]
MKQTAVFAFAPMLVALVGVALAGPPAPSVEDEPTPIGIWATADAKSHVQIKDCDGKLCGTIVWLQEPLDKDGKDALDSKNPEPGLRTRKILGLVLLSGLEEDEVVPNVWREGEIYSPDNGKTYSCQLTVENSKTLLVRGYIGLSIIGVTETWTRIE